MPTPLKGSFEQLKKQNGNSLSFPVLNSSFILQVQNSLGRSMIFSFSVCVSTVSTAFDLLHD